MGRVKNDPLFRGMAAGLIVSAMSISAYYRHRAEQTGERLSAPREEGLPIFLALRSSGLVLWASVLISILKPGWMSWARLGLPAWLRWSGAVVGTAVVPLAYWLFSTLGRNVSPTVATRREHSLVTNGPYRWVRHPLYSVGTALFVSLTLLLDSWFVGLVSAIALIMLLLRVPLEEARLIERFGDEYRDYMKTTGGFFPRLRSTSLETPGRTGSRHSTLGDPALPRSPVGQE